MSFFDEGFPIGCYLKGSHANYSVVATPAAVPLTYPMDPRRLILGDGIHLRLNPSLDMPIFCNDQSVFCSSQSLENSPSSLPRNGSAPDSDAGILFTTFPYSHFRNPLHRSNYRLRMPFTHI